MTRLHGNPVRPPETGALPDNSRSWKSGLFLFPDPTGYRLVGVLYAGTSRYSAPCPAGFPVTSSTQT